MRPDLSAGGDDGGTAHEAAPTGDTPETASAEQGSPEQELTEAPSKDSPDAQTPQKMKPKPTAKLKPEDAVILFLKKILRRLKRKKKTGDDDDELALVHTDQALSFNHMDLAFLKKMAAELLKLLEQQHQKEALNYTLNEQQRQNLEQKIINPALKEMEDALKKDEEKAADEKMEADQDKLEQEEDKHDRGEDELDSTDKTDLKDALAETFDSDEFKDLMKKETGLEKEEDKEKIEDLANELHDEAAKPDSGPAETPTLEAGK